MANVKIIVQFSGGKDSQACLIQTCKEFGANNVTAIFCDTGWEHELTYNHINECCNKLGVNLITLKNKSVDGMIGLCKRMRWFPSSQNRMCTVKLKIEPMIDWVLSQDDNLILIQGIRAKESVARAKFETQCSYFKEYFFEGKTKKLYRKKAVLEWCKGHDASVLRPIFDWDAQQVIDYILENGQKPNPLYMKGVTRVGCFPCIYARLNELKIMAKNPEYVQRVVDLEKEINITREPGCEASFFGKNKIPSRFCKTHPNKAPTFSEVIDYVTRKENAPSLFEEFETETSCMSLYHGLCE